LFATKIVSLLSRKRWTLGSNRWESSW